MRQEVSAGAVIYSPARNQFLLVQHRDGHWEFPKGKQEGDETLTQTLLREVFEETGMRGRLLTFRTRSSYYFYHKGKVRKTVDFGILLSDDDPVLSSEHLGFRWEDAENVDALLKFDEHKRVFSQAHAHLEEEGLL